MRPAEWTIETAVGVLTITRAGPERADAVLDILDEVTRWLLSRGIQQWEPGQFKREPLLEHLAAGEIYLATCDGAAIGTLRLQSSDVRIWGDMPDDALYLHSLAVRRAVGGQGLGRALLRWAEEMAAAAGKTYLRLDCMAENAALRAYYEQAGFTHVRDVFGKTWGASLFKKRVRP